MPPTFHHSIWMITSNLPWTDLRWAFFFFKTYCVLDCLSLCSLTPISAWFFFYSSYIEIWLTHSTVEVSSVQHNLTYMHHEMMTVSSVNIHHPRYKTKEIKKYIFPCVKNSGFTNFHMWHTAVSIIFIMSYITFLVLAYFVTVSLYLLTALIQLPLPLTLSLILDYCITWPML